MQRHYLEEKKRRQPFLYNHVSSGSTDVWLLETEISDAPSATDFCRHTADIITHQEAPKGVVLNYRLTSPLESLTSEVKRLPQWEEFSGSSKEAVTFEPLSERFWIFVGEVRGKFEEILPARVHIYTLSDGAFVLDAIFDGGRAACILRRRYAHLMVVTGDEMRDVVLEGAEATPLRVQSELRAALA